MFRDDWYGENDDLGQHGAYVRGAPSRARGPVGLMGELDWLGVRQDVEEEARGEIILLGQTNAGKSTLFNSLRGWPVTPTALKLGRQEDMFEESLGLFTLVDLPEKAVTSEDRLLERLERASLLVYVLDGAVGATTRDPTGAALRPEDCQWIGRLRSTGRPTLVLLNKADMWKGKRRALVDALETRLGTEVIPVSAYDSLQSQQHVLDSMIEACPQLAVPLGREVSAFRRAAAERITRRAALLCGLVAMQPIPLVDLPMQVGTQVGLVARIATMYGHPPSSDYSRELVVAGAGSAALRLLALQAAKLLPVVGWALCGVIAAGSTWLLGRTAVAYFDGSSARSVLIARVRSHGLEDIRAWCVSALQALARTRLAQRMDWFGRSSRSVDPLGDSTREGSL